MGYRFQRWLSGRNGMDALAKTSLIASLVLFIITMITRSQLLYFLTLLLLFYACFRTFSRNLSKRYYENQKFLQMTAHTRDFFKNFKDIGWKTRAFFTELGRKIRFGSNASQARAEERKRDRAFRIYACPTCGQKVRVPRGKGRIEIRCPKCQTTFIKRT
ncbi:MAG: hypothetical protein PUG16_05845 [Lachnospiraceae bacterium]|nr:hypothetical protein [Lachnospiraceae bacterium]